MKKNGGSPGPSQPEVVLPIPPLLPGRSLPTGEIDRVRLVCWLSHLPAVAWLAYSPAGSRLNLGKEEEEQVPSSLAQPNHVDPVH